MPESLPSKFYAGLVSNVGTLLSLYDGGLQTVSLSLNSKITTCYYTCNPHLTFSVQFSDLPRLNAIDGAVFMAVVVHTCE